MSERVFRKTTGGYVFDLVFPSGTDVATAICTTPDGTVRPGYEWKLAEVLVPQSDYVEVFDHLEPAELPPTTADLHTELAAYKQFADNIDAAFAKPSPRGLQLDYQHAYDRLRAVVPTKGSEA